MLYQTAVDGCADKFMILIHSVVTTNGICIHSLTANSIQVLVNLGESLLSKPFMSKRSH